MRQDGRKWGYNEGQGVDNEILMEELGEVEIADIEMNSADLHTYNCEVEHMEQFKDTEEYEDWRDELLGRCVNGK